MTERVLEPVGVEVDDVDPCAPSADDVERLRHLLANHGVVVLRDRPIDDQRFLAFLREFGEPMFTVGETPVRGHADLNVITNVGRTSPPSSVFHVDTSYVSRPPAYTALRTVQVPAQGGQTLFTNQYRAYDTLPDSERERLRDRLVRHVATGVDPGSEQETEADHPIFRVHPVSGRTALFLSTPARCRSISGLDDDDAERTIESLYAHSTREENVLRHSWAPGDVVMWDNGVVLHKADHAGVVGDRTMHRGMVDGYNSARQASIVS